MASRRYKRMQRGDECEWHIEHIIRLAIGCTDTFPNLIPICSTCNLAMGKGGRCTFDYMVRIGRMPAEQAQVELERHFLRCARFDPRCEAILSSSASSPLSKIKRCCNLKAGKAEQYCTKHIRANLQQMDCSWDCLIGWLGYHH